MRLSIAVVSIRAMFRREQTSINGSGAAMQGLKYE